MFHVIFTSVIFLIVIGGSIWSVVGMIKSSNEIYKKLDVLKEKAKEAKTKYELQSLWEELKVVSKECWHRSFSPKVVEIKTIIETKYEMLPD